MTDRVLAPPAKSAAVGTCHRQAIRAVSLIFAEALTACVHAPSPPEPNQRPAFVPPYPSPFTLTASGSRGQRFDIVMQPDHSWWGAFSQDGRAWVVTDAQCGSFEQALRAFGDLPAIRPGPLTLQRDTPSALPVPPTVKDGDVWTIETLGYAPDESAVGLQLSGGQGPYALWAGEMFEAAKACGPSSSSDD